MTLGRAWMGMMWNLISHVSRRPSESYCQKTGTRSVIVTNTLLSLCALHEGLIKCTSPDGCCRTEP